MCFIRQSEIGQLETVVRDPQSKEEILFPLKISDRPIVFPENHFLTLEANKNAVVFHPLSESNLKTPSEVIEVLRRSAVVRICSIASYLLDRAVEINHNTTSDSSYKMNHKLSDLFKDVPDVDAKFYAWYRKLTKEISTNASEQRYQLFNIHIKIDGVAQNNRYDRVTAITSPFYDYLISSSDVELPVSAPRKKDTETLKSLITSLFTELPKSGYVAGSNNSVAPTLLSFMEALSKIFKRLNNLLAIYGKEANDITNGNTVGTDWERDQNFSKLRSYLPVQEFNIGKESIKRSSNGEATNGSSIPAQAKKLLDPQPEAQPTTTTNTSSSNSTGPKKWYEDTTRNSISPSTQAPPPVEEPQQPYGNGYGYGNNDGGRYGNQGYGGGYGGNRYGADRGGYGYGNQSGGRYGYGEQSRSMNDRYASQPSGYGNQGYGGGYGYGNEPHRPAPRQPVDSNSPTWMKIP